MSASIDINVKANSVSMKNNLLSPSRIEEVNMNTNPIPSRQQDLEQIVELNTTQNRA